MIAPPDKYGRVGSCTGDQCYFGPDGQLYVQGRGPRYGEPPAPARAPMTATGCSTCGGVNPFIFASPALAGTGQIGPAPRTIVRRNPLWPYSPLYTAARLDAATTDSSAVEFVVLGETYGDPMRSNPQGRWLHLREHRSGPSSVAVEPGYQRMGHVRLKEGWMPAHLLSEPTHWPTRPPSTSPSTPPRPLPPPPLPPPGPAMTGTGALDPNAATIGDVASALNLPVPPALQRFGGTSLATLGGVIGRGMAVARVLPQIMAVARATRDASRTARDASRAARVAASCAGPLGCLVRELGALDDEANEHAGETILPNGTPIEVLGRADGDITVRGVRTPGPWAHVRFRSATDGSVIEGWMRAEDVRDVNDTNTGQFSDVFVRTTPLGRPPDPASVFQSSPFTPPLPAPVQQAPVSAPVSSSLPRYTYRRAQVKAFLPGLGVQNGTPLFFALRDRRQAGSDYVPAGAQVDTFGIEEKGPAYYRNDDGSTTLQGGFTRDDPGRFTFVRWAAPNRAPVFGWVLSFMLDELYGPFQGQTGTGQAAPGLARVRRKSAATATPPGPGPSSPPGPGPSPFRPLVEAISSGQNLLIVANLYETYRSSTGDTKPLAAIYAELGRSAEDALAQSIVSTIHNANDDVVLQRYTRFARLLGGGSLPSLQTLYQQAGRPFPYKGAGGGLQAPNVTARIAHDVLFIQKPPGSDLGKTDLRTIIPRGAPVEILGRQNATFRFCGTREDLQQAATIAAPTLLIGGAISLGHLITYLTVSETAGCQTISGPYTHVRYLGRDGWIASESFRGSALEGEAYR